MEQNDSGQNIQDFWQKNKNYIIAGIIIILAIIYIASSGSNTEDTKETNTQKTSQTTDSESIMDDEAGAMDEEPETKMTEHSETTKIGNVTATGKLLASDNQSFGNFMVESDKGKVYIFTKRDFSSLVGKEVTLNAEGTIDKFAFLSLTEAGKSEPKDKPKTPEAPKPTAATPVEFKGKLETSAVPAKGNYQVVSGTTTVYLNSSRDYSAWIGQEVTLKAEGTLESFTGAVLTK